MGFVFVKPFDENSNEEKVQLLQLLDRVVSSDRSKVQDQLNSVEYGIIGESRVNFELENMFDSSGYVYHDVCFEYNNVKCQVDFLILTRKYILLIEAKYLYGDIKINKNGEFIRIYKRVNGEKIKEGMDSPVNQNCRHIDILSALLQESGLVKNVPFKSLVCFSNPKTIIKMNNAPEDIKAKVIKTDLLHHKIQDFNKTNDLISQDDLDRIKEFIDSKHFDITYDYVEKLKLRLINNIEQYLNNPLYLELLDYRNNKSKELGTAETLVFKNEEAIEIVDSMPLSKEELIKVKGFGKVKTNNYGDDIIGIVSKYKN